jgi:hypothetical protein
MRTALAAALALPAVLYGLVEFGEGGRPPGRTEGFRLQIYGLVELASALAIAFGVLLMYVPTIAGSSIAEEREKRTFPLLLLTRLTRLELVAVKLAGQLVPSFLVLLVGVPLLVAAAWAAGLPAPLVLVILAVLGSTVAVAGALGVAASARRELVATARGEALAWTMTWFAALPLVSIMRVSPGTPWGDLLVELRRLAGWLALASPLSLLTDRSWMAGRWARADALSDRLLTMLAMQAVIIAAAVAGAVAGLRRREPRPAGSDPHGVAHPPVGDDPIYWREYELTVQLDARLPTLASMVRRLLLVVRLLVVLAVQAAVLAVLVATAIGVLVAAGWFAYLAFRENWGFAPTPPSGARDQFNWFIRFASGIVGAATIAMTNGVSERILQERRKMTWESLLTTPLTGREILASKIRVAARGTWSMVRWLVVLWLVGIVCGAVHPLGVLLAAALLAAGAWLWVALSLRATLRPGATAQSVNIIVAVGLVPLGAVVTVATVASLCSTRQFERLADGLVGFRWVAAVVVAGAPAMAATAAWVTRRCFERFDEWVGRPHRSRGAATSPRPAVEARAGRRTPSLARAQ